LLAAVDEQQTAAGQQQQQPSGAVLTALKQVEAASGLHRGQQLQADLAAMHKAAAGASSSSPTSNSGKSAAGTVQPGGSSAAFASYMQQLATTARSHAATQEERDRAALRLFACAYSLLSSFHSLGARVGASAAERSGAAAAGALRCYTDYPQLAVSKQDPAAALVAAVDTAGAGLSVEQKLVVYDELPRCFPKAALMVAALAHED